MAKLINQNFVKNKQLFNQLSIQLKNILGHNTIVEHVGSTAIPNILGKNIIDILVGAQDSNQFATFAQLLTANNYYPSTKSKTDIYQFFASSEQETGDGDVHIHLVIKGTDRYNEFIILRDYLLNNPDESTAYFNYKQQILQQKDIDRANYRNIKSQYVTALIARVKDSKK